MVGLGFVYLHGLSLHLKVLGLIDSQFHIHHSGSENNRPTSLIISFY